MQLLVLADALLLGGQWLADTGTACRLFIGVENASGVLILLSPISE